jgi:hypothetical protein
MIRLPILFLSISLFAVLAACNLGTATSQQPIAVEAETEALPPCGEGDPPRVPNPNCGNAVWTVCWSMRPASCPNQERMYEEACCLHDGICAQTTEDGPYRDGDRYPESITPDFFCCGYTFACD